MLFFHCEMFHSQWGKKSKISNFKVLLSYLIFNIHCVFFIIVICQIFLNDSVHLPGIFTCCHWVSLPTSCHRFGMERRHWKRGTRKLIGHIW